MHPGRVDGRQPQGERGLRQGRAQGRQQLQHGGRAAVGAGGRQHLAFLQGHRLGPVTGAFLDELERIGLLSLLHVLVGAGVDGRDGPARLLVLGEPAADVLQSFGSLPDGFIPVVQVLARFVEALVGAGQLAFAGRPGRGCRRLRPEGEVEVHAVGPQGAHLPGHGLHQGLPRRPARRPKQRRPGRGLLVAHAQQHPALRVGLVHQPGQAGGVAGGRGLQLARLGGLVAVVGHVRKQLEVNLLQVGFRHPGRHPAKYGHARPKRMGARGRQPGRQGGRRGAGLEPGLVGGEIGGGRAEGRLRLSQDQPGQQQGPDQ